MEINTAEGLALLNLLLTTLVAVLVTRRVAPLPVASVHACADSRACQVCNPPPPVPGPAERLLGRAWRILHGTA